MYHSSLLKEDTDLILNELEKVLKTLTHKKIFISGATGFFGKWLTQSLTEANLKMNLNLKLHLLSRDWSKYLKNHPNSIDQQSTTLHVGDIKSFVFPEPCEIIIHAAGDARPENTPRSIDFFSQSINLGSQRILEFTKFSQANKILLTSSGAIYGMLNHKLKHFDENLSQPQPIDFYGIAKYQQEKLFKEFYHSNKSIDVAIARCFAFVGPYLPLDKGYAIGNFIQNILKEESIEIKGSGLDERSYLYSADLVIWLIKILMGSGIQCLNVGSDQSLTILELAKKISQLAPSSPKINILQKSDQKTIRSSYIPCTEKAKREHNLKIYTPLDQAIKKTLKWHQEHIG